MHLRRGITPRFALLLPCLLTVVACAQIAADGESVDGARALRHAQAIVEFGPHPPGSPAQVEVGAYLISQLKQQGLRVETEAFQPFTPEGPLDMINIWGILPGSEENVVILASHYDSKLFRDFEFVGANDPAASMGLVLELARVLSVHNPTPLTFWFVFFDGEEALHDWTARDSLYGSRQFVRRLQNTGEIRKVKAMVLLDLIGGSPLRLYRETNSTPWLNDILWTQARRLGFSEVFIPTGRTTVEDDHVPFIRAGIPAADLIDLGYGYWHTAEDTIDKLSAGNLQIVGEVVRTSLPEISRRVRQP